MFKNDYLFEILLLINNFLNNKVKKKIEIIQPFKSAIKMKNII